MKKTAYWLVFVLGMLGVFGVMTVVLKTNMVVLFAFTLLACIGYITQDFINRKLLERAFGIAHKFFTIEDIEPPKRVVAFRTVLVATAVNCFWAAVGIDFVTGPLKGNLKVPESTDQILFDLAVFLVVVAIIPQATWMFNYGVKKSLGKK